jgi:integrase
MRRGYAEQNPWVDQSVRKKEIASASGCLRAFNAEELRRLFIASHEGGDLHDLMKLALFTGARINEVCSLKPSDIEGDWLHVRGTKTENALRRIPIPSPVSDIIDKRGKNAEWLFPEAKPGGPDEKRSWNIGKRANRFLKKILGKRTPVTFHSFRRSYATACEQVGLYEPTMNQLMGHSKKTLALRVYADGQSHGQLWKAQKKVEAHIINWLMPKS